MTIEAPRYTEAELVQFQKQLDFKILGLAKPTIKFTPFFSEEAKYQVCRTKFGGMPYAEAGDEWPVCTTCQNELCFLTQTHNEQINEILVFYYCIECNPYNHEGAGEWQARVYSSPNKEKMVPLFPEKPKENDGLYYFYQESLFLTIDEDECYQKYEYLTEPLGEARFNVVREEKMHPDRISYGIRKQSFNVWWETIKKLKLLEDENHVCTMHGYPQYTNGFGIPTCDKCDTEMFFYFKIALPKETDECYLGGELFLYRCPNHPDEIQMVWDGT